MPEVELGQLFWTNILNVVVQNIELIISARNDELISLFNWFFNGQYTLQFSYGDGKNWFCSDLYIHPYFVSLCLHYSLTLEKNNCLWKLWLLQFSSKHLKQYTKRQLHLGKYIKYTEMYKT